ncbi:MAG: Rhomboid family [Verrucomicrobiota bacterium]
MPCSTPTLALLVTMLALRLAQVFAPFDLAAYLDLAPRAVWHGELWRLFTAALLTRGLTDLVFDALALYWLAGALENHWKPREWPLYGALCVGVGSLLACALFPGVPVISVGPAGLIGALLVARVRLAPAERIQLSTTFSLPVIALLLLWAGCVALAAFGGGFPLSSVLAVLATAATGWLYLSLRWRFLNRRPAQSVTSGRFDRLEM